MYRATEMMECWGPSLEELLCEYINFSNHDTTVVLVAQ